MQGAPLIRNQVVQMRQPREKGHLTPTGVMEALHHKQFAVNSIVGLIEYRAHRRHLRVFEHRIPARLLILKPGLNLESLLREAVETEHGVTSWCMLPLACQHVTR